MFYRRMSTFPVPIESHLTVSRLCVKYCRVVPLIFAQTETYRVCHNYCPISLLSYYSGSGNSYGTPCMFVLYLNHSLGTPAPQVILRVCPNKSLVTIVDIYTHCD